MVYGQIHFRTFGRSIRASATEPYVHAEAAHGSLNHSYQRTDHHIYICSRLKRGQEPELN
jgi:hypothetical protein